MSPAQFDEARVGEKVGAHSAWPKAAFGGRGLAPRAVNVTMWPVNFARPHLSEFIHYPRTPLSGRAASGFKSRLDVSPLNYPPEFGAALARYVKQSLRRTAIA